MCSIASAKTLWHTGVFVKCLWESKLASVAGEEYVRGRKGHTKSKMKKG